MDKFEAGFEILAILSCFDGSVDKEEISVIKEYLQANEGMIKFDPNKAFNYCAEMTAKQEIEEFQTAAIFFKKKSAERERMRMLDFALKVIGSDSNITNREKQLFTILGQLWEIEIPRYLVYHSYS